MKDLTRGPVGRHVLQLAGFIALATTFQTLYFLADLYFVGRQFVTAESPPLATSDLKRAGLPRR